MQPSAPWSGVSWADVLQGKAVRSPFGPQMAGKRGGSGAEGNDTAEAVRVERRRAGGPETGAAAGAETASDNRGPGAEERRRRGRKCGEESAEKSVRRAVAKPVMMGPKTR